MPNQLRQGGKKLTAIEHNFVVIRFEMLSDSACVAQFVVIGLCKTHREAGNSLAAGQLAHQSSNGTRINPSTEKDPQRDIAHQARRDGLGQQLLELTDIVRHRGIFAGRRKLDVPILMRNDLAVLADQPVTRKELIYSLEQRLSSGDIPEGEKFRQNRPIDLPGNVPNLQ